MYKKSLLITAIIFVSLSLKAQTISAPLLLSPANNSRYVKTQKLTLSWLKVEGYGSYQVQISLTPGFEPENLVFSTVRAGESVTAPGLAQETLHYWRVRVNADQSDWSEIWKFTTTSNPVKVQLIFPEDGINNINTAIVEFLWSSDSANTNFNFQLSTDSEFSDTLRNIFTEDNFLELTNLSNGFIHYWRIRPFNVDGIPGEWSETSSFKTKLSKPLLTYPGNFFNNQDTSLVFRWNRVNTASIYRVELSSGKSFDDSLIITSRSTVYNQLKIDSLMHDSIYYWRVQATNAFNDSSSWSDPFSFKTHLKGPGIISPQNNAMNTDTSLTMKWQNLGLDYIYRVQLAEDSNYFWKVYADHLLGDSVKVSGLKYNQDYYLRVNIRDNIGDTSAWSNKTKFTTKLSSPQFLFPPADSVMLYQKIKLTWTIIKGAELYDFDIAYDSLFAGMVFSRTLKDTVLLIDSLLNGKDYYCRVKAFNSKGQRSDYSSVHKFSTFVLPFTTKKIASTINFSKNATDSVYSMELFNSGSEPLIFSSIFAKPDSVLYTDVNELVINSKETKYINIYADTSKVDTGRYETTLNIVNLRGENIEDTVKLGLSYRALKAAASLSSDSLFFDTTHSTNPAYQKFFLSNRKGNYTLLIDKIFIEGRDTSSFKLLNKPEYLNAGDSVQISISFKPYVQDSNFASVVIITNAYPNNMIEIPLTGIGRGGDIDQKTFNELALFNDLPFETLSSNNRKFKMRNSGKARLDYSISFVENYFKLGKTTTNSFKLQSGDSLEFELQYITPDFKEQNIDTMIIIHNGVGKSPYKFELRGGFDSLASTQNILNSITVDGKKFPLEDFVADQSASIQARIENDILKDLQNLEFKLNYYKGGPGKKLTAQQPAKNTFIIPAVEITPNGLLIQGELYSKGMAGSPADSMLIFEPVEIQTALYDFQTPEVIIPKSVPAPNPADADVKWVMFGFNYGNVIADTAFNFFGGVRKMQDGDWIVYEYDESIPNSFRKFNEYYLEPGKAYFIAQSIKNEVKLSYKYKELVLSRKLKDNIISFTQNGWKAISNPYNFDVEVDSNIVLYKYDTQRKSYKLTNIMKPGEGYFISPEVAEIKLKTYGQYFPGALPKFISDAGWHIDIEFSNGLKSENVLFTHKPKSSMEVLNKKYPDRILKAPSLDRSLEVYLLNSESGEKFYAAAGNNAEGNVWELNIRTEKPASLSSIVSIFGNIPENLEAVLMCINSNEVFNLKTESNLFLNSGERFVLIIGSKNFVDKMINNFNGFSVKEFSLSQNYPNPFNPATKIKYSVPSAESPKILSAVPVVLKVYDILGREVATLVNENKAPGNYEVTFTADKLASGVYFYELRSGSFSSVKKLMLLK